MLSRNRRIATQVAILVLVGLAVLALERFFLRLRVADMKPEVFAEVAIELRVTDNWMFGYWRSDHGALLVRSTRFELERLEEPWSPEGLTSYMGRDLRLLPWRIVGEVLLYLTIAVIGVVGGPWLAGRSSKRKALAWGAVGALSFVVLVLPHLVSGYGTGLYSNRWGPAPSSYTSPPASSIRPTLIPADTISYRSVLERTLYPGWRLMWSLLEPLGDFDVVVAFFEVPFVYDGFFWAFHVAFYFFAALVLAGLFMYASSTVKRLRRIA